MSDLPKFDNEARPIGSGINRALAEEVERNSNPWPYMAQYVKKENQCEDRRFQLAGQLYAAMWANPNIASATNMDVSVKQLAISEADALIAELEKKETPND